MGVRGLSEVEAPADRPGAVMMGSGPIEARSSPRWLAAARWAAGAPRQAVPDMLFFSRSSAIPTATAAVSTDLARLRSRCGPLAPHWPHLHRSQGWRRHRENLETLELERLPRSIASVPKAKASRAARPAAHQRGRPPSR
jgi:hypothetical protein